jgi:pimeloyl-ACP methyl ester carboxylesterase
MEGLAKEVPYSEVIAEEPQENFVKIGDQLVYCEDSGEGPVIVMLHGFASSSFAFRLIRQPLSRSFRVLTIDLNGFGLTQRPRKFKSYHHQEQSDLIIELLKSKGIERFHLMGHSYGAVISNCIAEHHPEKVMQVVLVSPPATFTDKSPWYLRGKLGVKLAILMVRLLLSNPAKFHQLSAKAVYGDETLSLTVSEHYRRSMLIGGLRDACLGYIENFGKHRSTMIRYEKILQPVLIIAGEEDRIVTKEKIEKVATVISQAETVFIPECGHCPPEEQPESVIKATRRFLAP